MSKCWKDKNLDTCMWCDTYMKYTRDRKECLVKCFFFKGNCIFITQNYVKGGEIVTFLSNLSRTNMLTIYIDSIPLLSISKLER
jgi:hypothetical protein